MSKAAQSGVHSLVALAAMAMAVVGATAETPAVQAQAEQPLITHACQPEPLSLGAHAEQQFCQPVQTHLGVSQACHTLPVDGVPQPLDNVEHVGQVCYGVRNSVVSIHTTVSQAPVILVTAPTNKPTAPVSAPTGTSGGGTSGVQGAAGINFCAGQNIVWPSAIGQWTAPLGCYAGIFSPNPANYPFRPSFGWCNWTPEEMHLNYSGSTALGLMKQWGAPRVGAIVWFNPGAQGASSAGHWAQLVAIAPDGVHGLILEMNFVWRGGGWGKEDYRFITLRAPGVAYLYA